MTKKQLRIPFKDGKPCKWIKDDHDEERDNYEFEECLEIHGFVRGCSSAVMILRPANDHGEDFNYAKSVYYQVFLTDSKKVIQNMMHGTIYGKWTFVKRGENFGIKLVDVLPGLPPGRYPNAFDMKDKFRYLTPVEMCRLQTLPDDYLDGIAPNTAMSLAGNGWTVDVIAHLLRSIERKQMNDIVKEFRKITDELMFGSSEMDTNVTCDKHEQNEAIRKSQNS